MPPPAVPVLSAIANVDGDGNYAVAWSAAAGATSYTLEEDDNFGFASPTVRYNGAGTSWNANCKAVGAYYYRVRASNSGGLSEWSNVASTAVQPPVLSVRLGYGLAGGSLNQYPEAASLKAGWYVDWNVQQTPQCPNGTEYVQMVRLHQNLTSASTGLPCPLFSADAWDRSKCPYASPPSYSFWPSADVIAQTARANPGSLWLIGNEMDRRDWPGGGQDEMLPELYATAYRDLYTLIKGADPAARLAIGGVIQATPLRLQYLTKAWDAYQQYYGTPMPVDVWNVHNFILKESINELRRQHSSRQLSVDRFLPRQRQPSCEHDHLQRTDPGLPRVDERTRSAEQATDRVGVRRPLQAYRRNRTRRKKSRTS